MVKKTEGKVLGHLANGPLTVADCDKLVDKIGKDQSKSRARDITTNVENEYAAQFGALTVPEQGIVRRAVQDYTMSSDAINTSCRNGAPNAAALNIDAAFQIYVNRGFTNTQRVVYRLMTYKPPAVCAYGPPANPGGPRIVAGDLIRDMGFFSTSEHRQFLINGIQNPPPGSVYVKFVIIGQGGMNVSGGGYTTQNEQQLLEQLHPKTHHFRTAEAGQAEILFPRGTILRIESVAAHGGHYHVSATIPNPQPGGGVIKNSFTGL
jgi:hypothetical protein